MLPEQWKAIEEIFSEAVDLNTAERMRFLDERCKGDLFLRREVERLLEGDDAASDFIESPVWTDSSFLNTNVKKEISDSLGSRNEKDDVDSLLGEQIGAFRIVREIGRGGMGAVYLGERADGEFTQKAAIKVIKRGMDSDFIVRRFRHERQILASFEHPNIARLLDGGTTVDGVPYFVMEFIEGETLYNYCDSRRLSIPERLRLFRKICSAIQYAHSRQIIHRDIKPSNILINAAGTPKLLDFGIAKILDPNLIHESVNPTASMLRMMTPDYASPEQVEGMDVTPASDIYSLGVLLYELLTGHRPYNFAGRALHEVTKVVCEVTPEPPSAILSKRVNLLPQYTENPSSYLDVRRSNLSTLTAGLSGNIDSIVMKALSKDPADRYSSVEEFSEDIGRHLNGAPVTAPRFVPGPKAAKGTVRKPSDSGKAVAVLPFKFINLGNAGDTEDRFLGLGLADALITRLSKVRRFVVRPTSSIIAFDSVSTDPIAAGTELKVDYILDGSIKKANDRLRVTVQLLDVAENAAIWATSIDETLSDVLTLEDTLSNRVIESLLPQLTGSELEEFAKRGTDVPEAFEHYMRGRYFFNSFTEDGLAKAFVSFHQAIAADPGYALAHAGIADYYNWLGMIGVLPPQECFQPAIASASRAVEIDPHLSEAHASLGFSLHAGEYDWSRAEHHLLTALDLNPSNASAYVWYSIVLFTEGRFDEGLEYARRSIEIDPLTPFNHHNRAWGLYYARRYSDAEAHYQRVIAEFPDYSFGHFGLSKVQRLIGKTDLALKENSRAHELMGEGIFSMLAEAECLAADGRQEAAVKKIERLKELSADRFVSPYGFALAYMYLDDRENALAHLERAFEMKEPWLNWMHIEPVFDPLRDEPRFRSIAEKIGYNAFKANYSSIYDSDRSNDKNQATTGSRSRAVRRLHDRTTLVIDETSITDSGEGETGRWPHPAARWRQAATIGGIIALLVVGYIGVSRFIAPRSPVLRPIGYQNPTLVVLPFSSDEPEDFNLGVGLADALTNKLGNIRSLRVLSANTGRALGSAEPKEIAADVGASFIVKGRLLRNDGRTILSASLINTAAESQVWQEDFAADNEDLFGMQTRLAERIWNSLGIIPQPLERLQVEKSYTQDPEAYELYLIGRYQLTRRTSADLRQAITTFGNAIKLDVNFAPAYVGMADAYALLNLYDVDPPPDAYQRAKEMVTRALSIDDGLAEAHATNAYIKFYADRDRNAAELDFRRSLQVNPSLSQAHHWFALFLAATGKTVEARQEIETARSLDPRSLAVLSAIAVVNFYTGDVQGAISSANQTLEIDRTFVPALKVKRWAYSVLSDRPAAAATFVKEVNYSGGSEGDPGWQIIAVQVGRAGAENGEAAARLAAAAAAPEIRANPSVYAYETALAYLALGDKERALDHLERAESSRAHGFNFAEVDPRLESLKREPRFTRLLERLKNP